ncbi:MAG TPA: asparagine synthase (glutamine-hydrolyzing) [Bacteroidia bacterium]|jgi:asparagine synthase (glutamine-hydrolysing)|nr:asparagine synthase (glutamine-hydrolyzing) [Bacteroidia bacterium]
MCGIAGFTIANGIPIAIGTKKYQPVITAMVESLKHRGPNAQNIWNNETTYLGHARLSIIDLSESANQPMHSSDGRYVIIYNGELYNYKDLKLELQRMAQGNSNLPYNFKTNSDTEVILAAYQRWGVDCLNKFNGMFAFALYDTQEKTLFIARDRVGIKPLYYAYVNDQLIFASEVRAILSSGFVERKLNRNAINEYFLYQTVHAPNTIIEEVKMLMPGHYIIMKDEDVTIKKYWDLNNFTSVSNNLDYNQTCAKTKELLFQAVERRLVADVPFGAFLSGGIDSSAVVGIMSKMSSKKVETFNVSFDEGEFSEAKYAKKIAKEFGTDHHEIKLSPKDFLDQLPESLNALDHPSGDGPNTYVVSKATKQAGITMALSGLGGDEAFAGYDVFKRMTEINKKNYLNMFPAWMRKMPASVLKAKNKSIAGDKIYEVLGQEKVNVATAYPISRKVFSEDQISDLLKDNLKNNLVAMVNGIKKTDGEHLLSYVSSLEINTYMQNILLRDTDQMSMAVALEVRVPFLDYKLLEFVLGVKDEFKYPSTPKKLLIDSLEGLLPNEIVNRPKMGFTLPWKDWMKNELKSFCEQNINSLSKRDFVNAEAILNLWQQFLKDDARVSWSRVWHLVVLENWLTKNKIN